MANCLSSLPSRQAVRQFSCSRQNEKSGSDRSSDLQVGKRKLGWSCGPKFGQAPCKNGKTKCVQAHKRGGTPICFPWGVGVGGRTWNPLDLRFGSKRERRCNGKHATGCARVHVNGITVHLLPGAAGECRACCHLLAPDFPDPEKSISPYICAQLNISQS